MTAMMMMMMLAGPACFSVLETASFLFLLVLLLLVLLLLVLPSLLLEDLDPRSYWNLRGD